jgi:hypothetical protein
MHPLLPASLSLAIGAASTVAFADTSDDIRSLRQEIDAIRGAYEARLQALEARLKAAEARAATPAPAAAPAPLSAPPTVASPLAAAIGTPASANAFNPAVSLILSGRFARSSKDPLAYAITGFPLPAGSEAGPGTRGFSLGESELGFAANVDPWWRGAANFALHADNTLSTEEAYVQTTALGNGLTLKAGRFYSGMGYLNEKHAHTWDFVDNPLAYQAMLGTQYGDDGVQLRWLAPTEQFVQLGAELGRGRGFPGGDNNRNGAGMTAFTLHTGGDVGDSHSWLAGVSVLKAKASGLGLPVADASGAGLPSTFGGSTRVWIIDGVWKWAPDGNATRTSFKLQGEILRSTRSGELVYDPAGIASGGDYRAAQSGWYLQGVYQFMPGWRVGLRTERLDAGHPDHGLNDSLYAASGFKPRKDTVMVDFSASEFSRLRLQMAQDRARPGSADRQLFVQYQMSLGAHGAHSY